MNGFCERADYISEIKKIKHPYDKGIVAREGIDIMEFETYCRRNRKEEF